ncbi:NAD-dependent epimerase/dehydratase family protein [Microbacterium sp. USHLN186]|uniref:NAD-dependent epimerase/dehydratase family protein n=1 Tax=Microbacterium sp. USHLN186 TaxID=3081286 RepID=UPI0030167F43
MAAQVLVLGGTGWLSQRIARGWRDAGADVTCLARGGRAAPEGTALVVGDRDDPAGYERVRGRQWDEVVDVSSRARHVREAVVALGQDSAHWTYVSSMSVYSDDVTIGLDESGPTLAPATEDGEYDYGAEKVAAERAVRALGEQVLIVRPGLIVGAGDPSDRFGYWAAAFARAGIDPVLVPTLAGRAVQVIDVDDLAGFLVGEPRRGVVNAIGDVHTLAAVLSRIRAAAGHTAELLEAADEWLQAHDVQYWMGERSLPLWLPADMPGFMRRDNSAYRAGGGVLRPLEETIRAVLDDERARGLERERRAGLTRADERTLIGQLTAR